MFDLFLHRNGDGNFGVDHGLFAGVGVIVENDKLSVVPAGLELFFRPVQQVQGGDLVARL